MEPEKNWNLNLFRSLDLTADYRRYRVQRSKLNRTLENYKTNSPDSSTRKLQTCGKKTNIKHMWNQEKIVDYLNLGWKITE